MRAELKVGPIPLDELVAALMLSTVANAEVAALLRQDSDWRLPALWQSEFRQVLLKDVRADLATPEQASPATIRKAPAYVVDIGHSRKATRMLISSTKSAKPGSPSAWLASPRSAMSFWRIFCIGAQSRLRRASATLSRRRSR